MHNISVRKTGFLMTLMLLVSVDCQNNSKEKVNGIEAGRFEHLKETSPSFRSAVSETRRCAQHKRMS